MATDELKLVHHRATRTGLQHGHDLSPRDPGPGQPVTLAVRVGPDLAADHVACYYTLDGSEPAGAHGVVSNSQVLMLEQAEVVWDTLVWGYLTKWRDTLPAQPEGTVVRYRIGAWAKDGPETFADWPDVKATAEQAAHAFFTRQPLPDVPPGDPSRSHTFTYHVDRLGPPAWAREAVIYHIFVDRFYPGTGRDWQQTSDLRGFCGGTLWGIAEKLDYIADLGATCLWLSPILPSPSHHGYDATDLYHVEPRLGGDEALRALVAQAHDRGIRVLLDLVCNHVSDQHPIFQDARSNPASPYRDWFTFDDSGIGYRTFFGVPSMPQVNVANPAARDWLIDIARFWLREFDVDGYRLDHANGPGPDFWSDFWAACKAEKPDCFCFGEVVDAPDVQLAYVGRLDGCLDFHVGDALRRTFGLGTWSETELERFLARHLAFFPENFVMPTFLDNHDMDRFLYIAQGDKEALRRAAAAQMRLPGPPIIYYGTEVGLGQTGSTTEGRGLHFSRVPMAWGEEQDRDLLAYYQALIQERRG
ncbi:MAG: alpha-amylase [Anaerolineae bacterium]|nr:alpha-amylase [Anaerolineae bacterium]